MTIYRERLWPAPSLYLVSALVIPASIIVFLPIDLTVGFLTAAVLYGGCVAALIAASPVIAVTDGELSAGRASIPVRLVGEVRGFSGAEATAERGIRLDARAWLMIRGWVDPVVRIEVIDPDDPVPYWLVSTRRPEAVAAAVATAKAR